MSVPSYEEYVRLSPSEQLRALTAPFVERYPDSKEWIERMIANWKRKEQ